MMVFNKISKCCAPLLALMVFISSLSFAIDFHYCQGQLKSFSVLGKAKNCHEMASKTAACHHHKKKVDKGSVSCSEGDNNCCNNDTVNFESDLDERIPGIDYLNLDSRYFAVALAYLSFYDLFKDIESELSFAHYKPPLIQKDIPVLFESFLL